MPELESRRVLLNRTILDPKAERVNQTFVLRGEVLRTMPRIRIERFTAWTQLRQRSSRKRRRKTSGQPKVVSVPVDGIEF
jgi:hypothetical protein